MDDPLLLLEREYCPPVDPALIYAICADFDLNDAQGVSNARQILDGIKQSAIEEQNSEFDASGSSGLQREADTSEVSSSTAGSRSSPSRSDLTSLTNGVSGISLSTLSVSGSSSSGDLLGAHGGYFDDAEKLPDEAKELMLTETFPTIRLQRIRFILKKCGGNYGQATDELLNLVYFENSTTYEDGSIPKGIDAFSEEHLVASRGRKGKGKKKKIPLGQNSSSSSPSPSGASTPSNIWLDTGKEIELIASKTGIPKKSVNSLYHKNGASIPATILALIEKNLKEYENLEPEPTTVSNAFDLTNDFPSLNFAQASAIIRLTSPSTASAHELAKLLTTHNRSSPPSTRLGGIRVIPQYAPLNLDTSENDRPATPANPPSLPFLPSPTAAALATARTNAFAQAASAYRRGKSDNLMKAASGYYAQLGHDYHAAALAMSAAEADALVAKQSTATQLDLHGVNVKDAMRIADNRVAAWWAGLGEERVPGAGRRGVGDGYSIIVGVGRHSEGGKGKLGPAVVRGLVKRGWRVEAASGVVTVVGKVRR
ncbi:uncharacterized protein BDZ99DRAFT_454996 [Mytilinidion resinicola]|uniref:Smr domain-containing protein n=1 Tax=Mytilinidion resinicola TaxID=574789 RepID=A0A6A6Y0B4_9PEZI|nr:uncharacterized protein BDZ99DRAFT_454996 [Mytilinidion resinicola]KAF2802251.1 hypothetical protein BDZ99DRAFT_454996 [Mytilinidion resinicola]